MEASARPDPQALWRAADYAGVRAALASEPPSGERSLLLARLLLRTGNPAGAAQALANARSAGLLCTHSQQALGAALAATAHATLNDAPAARAAMAQARAVTQLEPHIIVELDYQEAYAEWMLGAPDRANELIAWYLAAPAGRIEPDMHSRFFTLAGWLAAGYERYRDQAALNVKAVELLQRSPEPDAGLIAWALHALAALLRDIDLPEAAASILSIEERLSWTPDLSMQHFQTVRAIGWWQALQGDYIHAFRKLNAAKRAAPSDFAAVVAHLDHAEAATFSQQHVLAAAELAEADDLIRAIDWSHATWEEAEALLQAAALFAPIDADRAQELFDTGIALRPAMARNAGYAHDRRLDAYADYADALIRTARSDRRVARHRARRAYEVFEAIGYNWRAARAALLLHRLKERGDWLSQAEVLISPYPRSFVAQEVAACRGGHNPLADLTVRQREILERLRTGATIDQIGSDLQISANTVRVHITHIHRAFGVERRSQLLAEAARWSAAA